MGTGLRPLDFRDSVLMRCTGFYYSWALGSSRAYGSPIVDGPLYEVSTMPQPAIRAVALHGVTSVEDYKAYSGVSNCKN